MDLNPINRAVNSIALNIAEGTARSRNFFFFFFFFFKALDYHLEIAWDR